mmetsp:Transcript_2300/g.4732  ORF Transcript_2300/g.4732 Transcript_2300/m.4732 type:complete len:321 (+) Transcript_2300:685-1647(+)
MSDSMHSTFPLPAANIKALPPEFAARFTWELKSFPSFFFKFLRSKSTHLHCPWLAADMSGVTPSLSMRSKDAPLEMRNSIISWLFSIRLAPVSIRAVPPLLCLTSTSAPFLTSNLATSKCPLAAAYINAVTPSSCIWSTPAPPSKSILTCSSLPAAEATIKGVKPFLLTAFTEPPYFIRSLRISAEPCSHAFMTGVSPSLSPLLILSLTPSSFSSILTTSMCPPTTAAESADMPSLRTTDSVETLPDKYLTTSVLPSADASQIALTSLFVVLSTSAPLSTRYFTTFSFPVMLDSISEVIPSLSVDSMSAPEERRSFTMSR